jgi:hypothetical protein
MRQLCFAAFLLFALCAAGCGGGGGTDDIVTLDAEAAIENPRTFDLGEISTGIEFIPLDDSVPESLLGGVRQMQESESRFYIYDGPQKPVTIFDRSGKFISTRGTIGRGPDEMSSFSQIALDPLRDHLYIRGGSPLSQTILGYDANGNVFARLNSISSWGMAFLDGRLVVSRQRHEMMGNDDPAPGAMGVLLDIMSADLSHEQTVESPDPGAARIFRGGTMMLFNGLMSNNGESLLVKEFRCDTVFVYRDGMLSPSMILDAGRWAIPDGAWGENATVSWSNGFVRVNDVMDGGRYLLIRASGGPDETDLILVFDRRDPGVGSATGGFTAVRPDGKHGMSIGGVAFTPMYVRDNRLVGVMQALDIVDNAASITDSALAALAATLKEDSNPVIVIATLKE